MAGGDCDDVIGDWYWIYYVGPLLAAWAVAEVTLVLEMDVGEDPVDTEEEKASLKTPEEGTLEILKNAATADAESPESPSN